MLNGKELSILRIINEKMLVRKDELKKLIGDGSDWNVIISKLVSEGYINNLDSIGSQCFAITQKGTRAISRHEAL